MADKKFSDFTAGGEVQIGDTVVGLRSGTNYKFTFPGTGIKDSNGNYLFKYEAAGAASVNYLNFVNSATGNAPVLEVEGSDLNADMIIRAKGTGVIQMPANLTQLTQVQVDNLTLDGNTLSSSAGDINLVPNGTSNVNVGNYAFDADQTVGAGQDGYIMTYDNGTGLVSLEAVTPSTTVVITDDTTTNATMYPTWVTASTGNLPVYVSSSKMSFNPSSGLLTATSYAGAWAGDLISLAKGGTNANLTADNGAIVYSDSSKFALLASTATANQVLLSGSSGAPSWSTATYPATATSTGTLLRATGTNWAASTATFADTYNASELLYSNGANTVAGLTTANNGVLVTSAGGVPSISSTLPSSLTIPGYATEVGVQNQSYSYSADTGAADAYVVTLSPALSAYADGQAFTMVAANTNTGASTMNVNGLGAISITHQGEAIKAGNIRAGTVYNFVITNSGTEASLLNPDSAAEAAEQYFNSIAIDSPVVSVSSDGATITFSVEKSGGGNIDFLTSKGRVTLTAAPATVTLTAGTDSSPVLNYVYVLVSNLPGSTITASTTGWPAVEYIALATVVCQSAASLQTDGAFKVHAWTDHIKNSIDIGHGADLNYWIRQQNATWSSGVALTPSVGAATFDLASTAGVVLQLHQHDYPAFDTSTGSHLYVPNWNASNYQKFTDLTTVLTDASGASMSGKYYNLVVWGVVSEDSADCQLMVNVPTASYNNSSNAQADVDRTTVYTIPQPFVGCGFLIARLVIQNAGGAGGTFTLIQQEDLRSLVPATATGSGTGGITAVVDDPNPTLGGGLNMGSYFIKDLLAADAADTTKQLEIDINAATPSTKTTILSSQTANRSITLPDASGTLLYGGGALGTPSGGTLTNCTGLPISTGVSGLGANVATFLATPSSANLASAVTDETGSGALVFATSPTLVTPALGTPASGVLTNCTGLPVSGLANGTDGELITWSAAGAPTTVAAGTAGQVLTSSGAGAEPTFKGQIYDIPFNAGFAADGSTEDCAVQTYGELVVARTGSFTGEAGYIDVAPTGAALIVDIEKNGTTIYSSKPQFAATANTLSAGTLKTDGTEDFVSGDRITFKVTQIGSTNPGDGCRFTVKAEAY